MIKLIHGDCLDKMSEMPDGSVDMILADLPYGITACKWDSVIPFEPLWAHYKRVIKKNGAVVLFGSQPFTSALVMSNPKWFKYQLVWDKVSPTGHLNAKKKPLSRHEDIVIFSEGKLGNFTYNPEMKKGVFRNKSPKRSTDGDIGKVYNIVNHSRDNFNDQYYPTSIYTLSTGNRLNKVHPTQKPVALLEYLIKTYTNEGETVLDNVFGSCSTGIACINTGRSFIGIEKDDKYFEIAKNRIESHMLQGAA